MGENQTNIFQRFVQNLKGTQHHHCLVRYEVNRLHKTSHHKQWGLESVPLTSSCLCSSPGKLLDVDDQYYRELSTSRSEPCVSSETTSLSSTPDRRRSVERRRSTDRMQPTDQRPAAASRQTRGRAVTEPEPPKPARDNRCVLHSMSFVWKKHWFLSRLIRTMVRSGSVL